MTCRERGSTLLLFPAALLVMVVLAAVTVDLARVRLGGQQADALAGAVANDTVTVGLDPDALRAGEDYRLDPRRVDTVAARAERLAGLPDLTVTAEVIGNRAVAVDVRTTVRLGFAAALPGARPTVPVRAGATARAVLR